MSVEFLSEEQASGFGRFLGEPSRADLERFFYLDDADLELIARRRGDHNRLGFAVQLGTIRFLGVLLADPLDVPWGVIDYLSARLGIADPSVVKNYMRRRPTVHEHAREIRTVYGYRDLAGPVLEELSAYVYSRAWTHGEGPTVLFELATAWLRRERVLLPGVTTLVRVVQSAREAAQSGVHGAVATAASTADPQLPVVLRGLLASDQGERASRLEALRAGPTRVSGPELDKALGRVAAVRALGAGAVDLSAVPPARVRALARYGIGAKAQSLRRLAEPRRTATLVATVTALEANAVDDALDLFDLLMTTRVLGPSRRAAAAEQLAKMPELEKASRVLARVGARLLRVLEESGDQVDVAAAWTTLEQVAARDQIAEAVATVGSAEALVDSWMLVRRDGLGGYEPWRSTARNSSATRSRWCDKATVKDRSAKTLGCRSRRSQNG